MKKDITTYIPFQHNNFDYIKNVIEIARSQNNSQIEGVLSSTLVYINAVDYIASHLLENLYCITNYSMDFEFFGTLFRSSKIERNLPLGPLIKELDKFNFPDRDSFIEDLKCFLGLRNKVAHNLLSLTPEELLKIDNDLEDLKVCAERLFTTYDNIVRGITAIWNIYTHSKPQLNPNLLNKPEIDVSSVKTDTDKSKNIKDR